VGKIIYLRQHDHFGPAKIAMYLKRYHDIQISTSGVWRILKRLELNRLPASQRHQRHDRRWKRYEKPLPWAALGGGGSGGEAPPPRHAGSRARPGSGGAGAAGMPQSQARWDGRLVGCWIKRPPKAAPPSRRVRPPTSIALDRDHGENAG
jgi:hypothetical protein